MNTQPKPDYNKMTIHQIHTFYLSAAHLEEGKASTVTINAADIRPIFDDKAGKELPAIVIHFSDARRSLKCNKTQTEALWTITGSDNPSQWVGHKIRLEKVPTKRGGKFTIKITAP